jgi:hypothetical protein
MSCVPSAFELLSDDEVPIPFLHVTPPKRPFAPGMINSLSGGDNDEDLHRYCHTREGIGHALQAGEQATSSFV